MLKAKHISPNLLKPIYKLFIQTLTEDLFHMSNNCNFFHEPLKTSIHFHKLGMNIIWHWLISFMKSFGIWDSWSGDPRSGDSWSGNPPNFGDPRSVKPSLEPPSALKSMRYPKKIPKFSSFCLICIISGVFWSMQVLFFGLNG